MAKEWAQVAGGLLQGLGTGMVENGRAAREARLAELEHGRRKELIGIEHGNAMARQEADHTFRAGENQANRTHDVRLEGVRHGNAMARQEADHGFRAGESAADRTFRAAEAEKERDSRRGLLSNTERFTDADGRMWQRTPQGVEPVVGPDGQQLQGARDGAKSTRSMALKDKELIDAAVERHTSEVTDPNNEFAEPREVTDWNAVARSLREAGRPDLARMYEGDAPAPAQEGGATSAKMGQNGANSLKRGDKIDGYVFQGGDPNDPANWKEAR